MRERAVGDNPSRDSDRARDCCRDGLLCHSRRGAAGTIAPVGGYRFGGGFFEQVTQQQVNLDGAPVFGSSSTCRFTTGCSSKRSRAISRAA